MNHALITWINVRYFNGLYLQKEKVHMSPLFNLFAKHMPSVYEQYKIAENK